MLKIFSRFYAFLRELRRLARISDAHSIARRLFVTNSFDGLISTLGIILGAYAAGVKEPTTYVYTVIGGAFALGFFSGIVATYLSERAERLRELHETERVMLHNLNDSIYAKAAQYVPLYVSIWSGIGAMILPITVLTPFFVKMLLPPDIGHFIDLELVILLSIVLALCELFLLGFYLGKISGENRFINGVKFVAIGLAAVAALILFKVAG